MVLFSRHSCDIPPQHWGSPTDIQRAVRVNSEKIYDINPDNTVLAMPFFWGLQQQDYGKHSIHSVNHGAISKDNKFYFNASPYIDFGLNSPLLIQGEISIYVRVSLNSDYTTAQTIIGDATILASQANYGLNFGYVNNKFDFWNNATGSSIISNKTISDNNIHNVVITRSGVSGNWTLKLYLDGKLDKTETAVATNPNAPISYQVIGKFGGYPTGYRWNGFIYDIMVSTDVYNAKQVALLNDIPYGLYQKVSEQIYLMSSTPTVGWTGKINAITNPAKINGVVAADIASVMGQ